MDGEITRKQVMQEVRRLVNVGTLAPLRAAGVSDTALVVTAAPDVNVRLSTRNIEGASYLPADVLNTYDVLVSDDVVFTRGALEVFLAGPVRGKGAKAVATESEALEEASEQ